MDTVLLEYLQIDPKSICSLPYPLNDVDALKIMRWKIAVSNDAVSKLPTSADQRIAYQYPQLFAPPLYTSLGIYLQIAAATHVLNCACIYLK